MTPMNLPNIKMAAATTKVLVTHRQQIIHTRVREGRKTSNGKASLLTRVLRGHMPSSEPPGKPLVIWFLSKANENILGFCLLGGKSFLALLLCLQ